MKHKSTRDLSEEESGPIGRAVRTFFLQPLKDDEGHRVPHFDALNYFCFALVMTAFAVAIWYFRSQTNLSIISVNTFDGLSKCIDTPLFNAEYKGQFLTSFFADDHPDVTLFDLNFGRFRFSPEYQVSWTIRFTPVQPQWQDPSNVNRMQDLLRRAPFNVSASAVRNSTDWVQRIVQYVRNEPSPFGTLHSAQVYYSIQPRFINHGMSLLMSFETFPNCSGVLETSNYRLPFFTAEYQRMALVNYNCANYGEQFNSSYFSGTETPCGPCNQTLNNSADYAYLLEKMAPLAIAALYEQVLPRLCLTSDPLPVLQVLSLAISVTALFLAFVRLVLVPAGSSLLRGLSDNPAEAELSADREDARYLPLRAPDQASESERGQQ